MIQEVVVRPEQARKLLALNAEAAQAVARLNAALDVALAGVAEGTVTKISEDGTLLVNVPDKE